MRRPLLYIVLLLSVATVTAIVLIYYRAPAKEPLKDDSQLFSSKLEHFRLLEDIALEAMQQTDSLPMEDYITALKKTALPDWADCVNLMDEVKKLKLDQEQMILCDHLHRYANQRIQQTLLYIKSAEDGTRKFDNSIDSIEFEISLQKDKIKESNLERPGLLPETNL